MSERVLECQEVGHWYRRDRWVFQNCSFELNQGSILAILGANGAGKTTLLRILLQLLDPKAGKTLVKRRMGFVPQLFEMRFDYIVLDVVLMGRVRHIGLWSEPSNADRELAFAALEQFGIQELALRNFQELSGGQRQMVMIARAMVSGCQMLVMDEPASSLDLRNQQLILQWIDRLSAAGDLTTIFTTHNPQHAQSVATHVLLMNEKGPFQFGSAAEVLSESNLRALYGISIRKVEVQQDERIFKALVPLFNPGAENG